MPLVYDHTRTANQGGGWIERPDAQAFATTELPRLRAEQAARYQASKRRWGIADKFAWGAVAAPLAVAAAPAVMGAGAASAGAGSAAATAGASAAGGGMTFGNLLQLGQLGAGLVTNGLAMRTQGRQANADAIARARELADQTAFTRETEATRRAEFQAAQDALERRWLAEQKFEQDKWRVTEDERLHTRELADQREARRAPYRAMSQQALLRLGDLLRLGRG